MVLGKILEVDISSVCYHKTKELGRGEEKQGFQQKTKHEPGLRMASTWKRQQGKFSVTREGQINEEVN